MNIIFQSDVKENFDFLIDEYGFSELGKNCGYIKGPLEIEFYTGKGETDITFFVRRDDDIFRPYISRSFYLVDLVYLTSKEAIDFYSHPSGAVNNTEYLPHCAVIMQRYFTEILKGNLEFLEKLHLERRDNA